MSGNLLTPIPLYDDNVMCQSITSKVIKLLLRFIAGGGENADLGRKRRIFRVILYAQQVPPSAMLCSSHRYQLSWFIRKK